MSGAAELDTLTRRLGRRWIRAQVDADGCGATHWDAKLAGLIRAAPVGVLEQASTAYPSSDPNGPDLAVAVGWSLANVLEHAMFALASFRVFDGAPLPAGLAEDLELLASLQDSGITTEQRDTCTLYVLTHKVLHS